MIIINNEVNQQYGISKTFGRISDPISPFKKSV